MSIEPSNIGTFSLRLRAGRSQRSEARALAQSASEKIATPLMEALEAEFHRQLGSNVIVRVKSIALRFRMSPRGLSEEGLRRMGVDVASALVTGCRTSPVAGEEADVVAFKDAADYHASFLTWSARGGEIPRWQFSDLEDAGSVWRSILAEGASHVRQVVDHLRQRGVLGRVMNATPSARRQVAKVLGGMEAVLGDTVPEDTALGDTVSPDAIFEGMGGAGGLGDPLAAERDRSPLPEASAGQAEAPESSSFSAMGLNESNALARASRSDSQSSADSLKRTEAVSAGSLRKAAFREAGAPGRQGESSPDESGRSSAEARQESPEAVRKFIPAASRPEPDASAAPSEPESSEITPASEAIAGLKQDERRWPTKFAGLFYLLRPVLELELAEHLWCAGFLEGVVLAHVATLVLPEQTDDIAPALFGGTSVGVPLPAIVAEGWAIDEILRKTAASEASVEEELRRVAASRFGDREANRVVVRCASALVTLFCARLSKPPELDLVRKYLNVPGEIRIGAGELAVLMPLESIDPDVRRAGLDINPGNIPWLSRNVAFSFLGAEDRES
jgi:hypothetical protein